MKRIYLFSGLGADERAFQYLTFPGYDATFIKWIQPLQNETIVQYSQRLATQIKDENPILIGLSFGGIVAVEVAKFITTEKIILIASAKTKQEIPFYYRLAGFLQLHKLLAEKFLNRPNSLINWLFGVQNEAEKKLLSNIIYDTDPVFMKWAIDKIVNWKNPHQHPNLKHIHGTADRILPFRFVHCDLPVKKGGHFMTINKANEISKKIMGLLENNP